MDPDEENSAAAGGGGAMAPIEEADAAQQPPASNPRATPNLPESGICTHTYAHSFNAHIHPDTLMCHKLSLFFMWRVQIHAHWLHHSLE